MRAIGHQTVFAHDGVTHRDAVAGLDRLRQP